MTKILSTIAALALAVAVANPAFAAGKKVGFAEETDTSATQGSGWSGERQRQSRE